MVSKIQERIYAEKAGELLGWQYQFNEIPEPLDFEVSNGTVTWGIEVRNVFKSEGDTKGSCEKASESLNLRSLLKVARDYYDGGGTPILVKILGASFLQSNPLSILSALCDRVQGIPWSCERIPRSSDAAAYVTDLPEALKGYSRWQVVDHHVGWVRPVTQVVLQQAIDAKALKLSNYKTKYERIDLLLVADRGFGSGRLSTQAELKVQNPGFDNIYFLSYPDTIQLVS